MERLPPLLFRAYTDAMADFPSAIFTPRTVANLPGISYEPTEMTTEFAEDYSLPAAEIAAIETTLGVNPQGAYATVRAWLDALAAAVPASPLVPETSLAPAANISLDAYNSAVAVGSFEIVSGYLLTLATGSVLAIL